MVAIVSVDVPLPPAVRVTVGGANANVIPVAVGEDEPDRVTVPAKLLMLVNVTVDVAEPPAVMLAGLGAVAVIPIFGGCPTTKLIVALWLVVPLVPVTVTV